MHVSSHRCASYSQRRPWNPSPAIWCSFMAPYFLLELKSYGQWLSGGKRRLCKVANPSSHLPLVGNFVGAILASKVGRKEAGKFLWAVLVVLLSNYVRGCQQAEHCPRSYTLCTQCLLRLPQQQVWLGKTYMVNLMIYQWLLTSLHCNSISHVCSDQFLHWLQLKYSPSKCSILFWSLWISCFRTYRDKFMR